MPAVTVEPEFTIKKYDYTGFGRQRAEIDKEHTRESAVIDLQPYNRTIT